MKKYTKYHLVLIYQYLYDPKTKIHVLKTIFEPSLTLVTNYFQANFLSNFKREYMYFCQSIVLYAYIFIVCCMI